MIVALASSGVRLMPSIPSTMAPATTKTKKRHMLATSPAMVATRAAGPGRTRAGGRLVRHPGQETPDALEP